MNIQISQPQKLIQYPLNCYVDKCRFSLIEQNLNRMLWKPGITKIFSESNSHYCCFRTLYYFKFSYITFTLLALQLVIIFYIVYIDVRYKHSLSALLAEKFVPTLKCSAANPCTENKTKNMP